MMWIVENPLPILLLGIAAEAVLVVVLFQSGRGAILLAMAAVAVVTAALLLVEWLVVTDTERIETVLYRAAAALRDNDVDGVIECLAPAAVKLRRSVAARLANLEVVEARITSRPNIRINRLTNPPAATGTFFGRVRVEGGFGGVVAGPFIGRVTVELEKRDDQWAIVAYQLAR
jgi:hypothetical protein